MIQSVITLKLHYSVTASWTAIYSSFPAWKMQYYAEFQCFFHFLRSKFTTKQFCSQKYLWLSNFLTYAFMVSISIFISVNLEGKQNQLNDTYHFSFMSDNTLLGTAEICSNKQKDYLSSKLTACCVIFSSLRRMSSWYCWSCSSISEECR